MLRLVSYAATCVATVAMVVLAACTSEGTGTRQLASSEGIPDRPDYNWDVRPILSQNCFSCHGNSQQKAGLRLDIDKAAYGRLPDNNNKRAIVRGNPDASEMIRRIISADPEERMPLASTHKILSKRDIAILTRWIEQGAEYKQHWAYIPPKVVRPDSSPWDDRAASPIDRYVFAKLATEGLEPSREADRETLINRVTLDLTGLPPTLEQVDAFIADKDPDAYGKLVDRLLASRHYAERQATVWMDVARYADSDGFQFDNLQRIQFPYRDWVVSAFQRNMPYDQFVTWQLAGDKLPNPTPEQILATSFARMGKRSNEMGIIDEEYRVEYGLERTELVGKAFLGLTVGCAKCHDHKYDVISQKDFYSLYAFFNQVDERGIAQPGGYGTPQGPTLAWPSPLQAKALADAQKVTAAKEAEWRTALDKARVAIRPDAKKMAAAATRADFLRSASARDLSAYYPLDATYKAPFTDLTRGFDGVPVAARSKTPGAGFGPPGGFPGGFPPKGKLPPPPNLEGIPLGEGGGLGAMPSPFGTVYFGRPDPGLPRLAGVDLRKAQMKQMMNFAPPPELAGLFNPFGPPSLPSDLGEEKLFWTPSGVTDGKPGAVHNAVFVPGAKGKAMLMNESVGMAYPGVGFFERTDPFTLDVWVKLRKDKPYDEVNILHNRSTSNVKEGTGYELQLVDNHLRFRLVHSQPYNAIAIVAPDALPTQTWVHVTATYDGSSKAAGLKLYVNGSPLATTIEADHLTRTTMPQWPTGGTGSLVGGTNNGFSWGKQSGLEEMKDSAIDEVKVFTRALTPIEVVANHDPAMAAQAKARTVEADVVEILAARDPKVIAARAELTKARLAEQKVEIPIYQLMVLADRLVPRKTYVLQNGLYNVPRKDEEVEAQGLERVFHWKRSLPKNRLGLTEWLFDEKNPLTARVFVNRLWQGHFGVGIVDTVEDFGSQGSNPTHPQLLDYLAVEFQRSGWDIRHMHKLMVTSATYRQASTVTPALLEKDPRNLLLARGPRYRMPAELIRDNALFASGLLVDKAGGDAVFPYQPEGVWSSIGVPAPTYPTEVPDDQMHRRSMYTFVRRNAAYPSLTVFDMPDRNVSTVERKISNTPLQALVLLNDVQYVEAYRKLAERAIKSGAGDQQLVTLFRLATRRHPTPAELDVMRRYLAQQTENMTNASKEAEKLLAAGVAPRDPAIATPYLAAMTLTTAVVMNTPDAYSLR